MVNMLNKYIGADVHINFSIEQKNILQVILLIIIGLICDAFILSIISTLYIPEIGWGVHSYSKLELLYRQIFFRYLYSYTNIISLIIGSICLLLFKVFLFPKIIISIENNSEKTTSSEIIKNIHGNKNSLLYCFIIFCLLSFLFLNGYSDIYNLNEKYTYLFVIPIHYLLLYLYWLYIDTKNSNLNKISDSSNKNNSNLDLFKYILLTNPFFIIISLFSLFNKMLNIFPLFEIFIILTFIMLFALLVLFYLCAVIKLLIKSIKFFIKSK